MCNTDVFFHIFYWSGWFPAHLDGLWSVRGHLPPSPLHHHHGTGAVHLISNCVLDSLLCQCPVSHPPPDPAVLLCWPQHPPFLLWPWCPAEALLLRHIPQRAGHFHSRSGRHCPPTSMHPDFLWPHRGHHPEGPLHQGDLQSIVHMWLPPLCGFPILWDNYWIVYFTLIQHL